MLPYSGISQSRFDVNLDVKNMHYWRGLRVSNSFVTAPMLGYYNNNLSVFTWAGMSVDGQYKEVSQIISYSAGNFSITLLDIFNFSDTPNADYFNFKADETNHITDLSVSYNFTDAIPLTLMMATVLYGNDRDSQGDNRYSSYLEAGFPIAREAFTVQPFIASGFTFGGSDNNSLYGSESFAIVNVGVSVLKKLELGAYTIPIKGTLGFNPSLKQASLEIAMSLF
jgi:hypothetical protein